jgi:hypothetical protein
VPLLETFKPEQQSLELIFPGKGPLDPHPQRMDGLVEEALASTLRVLTVPRILWDVGDQACIEDALPIACGIKAAIEVEVNSVRLNFCMEVELSDASGQYERPPPLHSPTH